jgi:hypothetical protein
LILSLAGTSLAEAQFHHAPMHQHFDGRFAHNHYYLDRGYVVEGAPRSGFAIEHGPQHFWYDRGQWYRRDGVRWIVVGAPIGAFVPVLPPFFTTVWFHGVPYYYANDTYYTWDDSREAYEVVAPPDEIDSTGSAQAPSSDSIFIYPKNGQSSEQQGRDRYECYRSAVDQTGYDPTQPGGGVRREIAVAKRADYFRAQAACLDARGYSVK